MTRSIVEIRARFARGLPLTTEEETLYRLDVIGEEIDRERAAELRDLVRAKHEEVEELASILSGEGGYPRRAAERLALKELIDRLGASELHEIVQAVSDRLSGGTSLLQSLLALPVEDGGDELSGAVG